MVQKYFVFIFLLFHLSCQKKGINHKEFTNYSSPILDNPNYSNQSYSFSSEYKIVRWYKNQSIMRLKKFIYNSDGFDINGYIMLPYNFSAKNKYPTILHLRGGWGNYKRPSLFHFKWLSSFVEKGYIIVSSDLRGVGKNEALDEFGGDDFNDILRLLDLIKNTPFIDKENIQSISWGSRGGVMSYLLLKEDSMVKSFIVINGASDLNLLEKTRPKGFFNKITKNSKKNALNRRSGVHWPEKFKRPVFIIHGKKNKNTPVEHAIKMANLLKHSNKTYQLKIFENSGHSLEKTNHIELSLKWFNSYVSKQ